MKHEALVKLGPIVSLDALNTLGRPGRLFYPTASRMVLAPNANVLVDHDRDRPIGRVLGLLDFDDTDGRWLFAKTEVDSAPGWLKRGTRASFAYATLCPSSNPAIACHRGYVTEVSLLSPGREPREPRAHVMAFREAPTPSVAANWPPGTRVVNRPDGSQEIYHEPGVRVIRPNTGRVLGVY